MDHLCQNAADEVGVGDVAFEEHFDLNVHDYCTV